MEATPPTASCTPLGKTLRLDQRKPKINGFRFAIVHVEQLKAVNKPSFLQRAGQEVTLPPLSSPSQTPRKKPF